MSTPLFPKKAIASKENNTGSSNLTVGHGPTGSTEGASVHSGIDTIIFDSGSDFTVRNDNPNTAFVTLNSTFKYWEAN